MSFPTTKFYITNTIVAVVPEPQRDEPPGRGEVKETTVTLVEFKREIHPAIVKQEIVEALARSKAKTP